MNNIKGIPNGVIIGQLERTTELDERILDRRFPSKNLKPNYDPRPISTKYSQFPTLSGRKPINEGLKDYNKYNVHDTFNPGTSNGPVEGFLTYVDNESYLRNQSVALQKGSDQSYYVPQKNSELYKDPVFNSENIETYQPHPNLFLTMDYENNRVYNPNLNSIGKDIFHNNTRTQLRNMN